MEEPTKPSRPAATPSLRLGRLGGVPVHADTRFLGLVVLAAVFFGVRDASVVPALRFVGTLGLVLACVLWHEVGHAALARRLGVPVVDIRIHAFYGVTRMEAPRTGREEVLIALGGPAASLAAALALFVPWLLLRGRAIDRDLLWLLENLLLANALLGCLNLLPAFPMDGGRVLRAVLRTRHGLVRATRIAVFVGRGLAAVMLAAPLWLEPPLLGVGVALIGVVVLVLGEAEWRRTREGARPADDERSATRS